MPRARETAARRVRAVVEAELAELSRLWQGAAAEEHNVFLKAISPTLAGSSKLTRQLTSRLGGKLARIARKLAEERFGAALVPTVIAHPEIDPVPHHASTSNDCFVFSCLDHDLAVSLANGLITTAGSDRSLAIGTDGFRDKYEKACEEISRSKRTEDAWAAQVDLAVLNPEIGFAELESGGQLDSSNVIGQPRKLVLAGLASGRPEVALHFCLAYANRGEGQLISGSLRRYFVQDTPEGDGLLVGSKWWERVLPVGVDFAEFLTIFHDVAANYEIAGPKE